MAFSNLWPLVAFAAVATLTPGGATTLATASGAHFGFRRSIPLIAGLAAGLASMAAAAAAGLAGLLLAEPSLQIVMKVLGSIYLAWLAWTIGRGGPPHRRTATTRPARFIGGIWMLWYNPKAWAMTLSAAASFATLASTPSRLSILLGLIFGAAAASSLSLWCIAGQWLARRLQTDRQWRALNSGLGIMLAASILPVWF